MAILNIGGWKIKDNTYNFIDKTLRQLLNGIISTDASNVKVAVKSLTVQANLEASDPSVTFTTDAPIIGVNNETVHVYLNNAAYETDAALIRAKKEFNKIYKAETESTTNGTTITYTIKFTNVTGATRTEALSLLIQLI